MSGPPNQIDGLYIDVLHSDESVSEISPWATGYMVPKKQYRIGIQNQILLFLGLFWTNVGLCQHWEVTPLIGYGLEGEFEDRQTDEEFELSDDAVGALAINYTSAPDDGAQLEVYLSRQETQMEGNNLLAPGSSFDLDVDYYHVGGMLEWGNKRFKPFFVGTVGATYLNPGPSAYDSLTRPSLGLGGGVKLFPIRNIGVRLEGRVLSTLAESDSAIVNDATGLRIYVKGDVFFQFHFNAGIIIRF